MASAIPVSLPMMGFSPMAGAMSQVPTALLHFIRDSLLDPANARVATCAW